MGIFGFCDIRNFTDATEVLQEDVMIFVNQIGEIVHNVVDFYSGAPNKNIGDAFLLVWKFDEKDIVRDSKGDIFLMQTNKV
jgi:class 3 adenylate cyclase